MTLEGLENRGRSGTGIAETKNINIIAQPYLKTKMNRYLFFFIIFFMLSIECVGQIPFSKGVNLTGWFQASAPRQIQFSKFTKKDFQNIKSMGCDVIRLPINLHAMTSGSPDYIPDPLFLDFLDQAVDWAEELKIHLILDNHTFDVTANTNPDIGPVLVKVWTQMAKHFKNRQEFLYYEILNEPHGIDDGVWSDIQQTVIDAIRTEDTSHYIVVGPANWNNYQNLKELRAYSDTKLIYTFHFYDPFIFTHQGASWVNPSMVPLSGVPFPFKAASMPATPASLKGSWIESGIKNYANDGTVNKVKQLIDMAVAFKNQRGVPVFCGEFGVYIPNSPGEDRVEWYNVVRNYLNEKNIPWTIWDYTGGFGIFEKNSGEVFEYDLNVPLLQALDFAVPAQDTYFQKPLTNGFPLYEDDFAEGMVNRSASGTGILDFYSSSAPQNGNYCIYWTGVGQYDAISFDFKNHLDLSLLKENDYTLQFSVRGNSPGAKFDVRFIDSKRNESDLPWRMGKTMEGIPADNQWHSIVIALKNLEEKGAWENVYYPPNGNKFEWTSVDRFEIIPEHQALTGIEFSFDGIYVAGEPVTITGIAEKTKNLQLTIYPNPVFGNASIEYTTMKALPVTISVLNVQGKTVKTFGRASELPGHHVVKWNGTDDSGAYLSEGLYFIRMKAGSTTECIKVMIGG
ncbi:MAG: cellulase family glycosylhydrolase [Cyclobacteriaceae bacterium]